MTGSSKTTSPGATEPLGPASRRRLLELARRAVEERLEKGRSLRTHAGEDPALDESRGAFVTFHVDGHLRGCIGSLHGHGPLRHTVAEMAVAAATDDPRFPPMTLDEVERADIEISALTPFQEIAPEDVEVGRHGLLVQRGRLRGVLLPQVPVDQGWDRETFLAQTCRKAGLPPDAWRDERTHLYAFSADVFGESGED
ncbi:MAG: AmmeMemoRadiSam system protein A [Myxococcota bacterium]